MSKMDRQLNSKNDKETIYEIYRACRLCGAGAGYKMPIIQSVIDVDDTDVELKQKVRECVQIEVHQDDKMPPLICELCVDKVNDFYEFLEMCRQTNKRTRLRLGLPPQSMPRGAPDAGECILGLTEPVYVNEDSDGEPLSKQKKMNPKVKVKREPELKVRLEKRPLPESRSTRLSKRSASPPPRLTRHRTSSKEDSVPLNRVKDKPKSSPKPAPKSILKNVIKNEDNSLLVPRLKRSRDKEPVKLDTSNKRVKIATKTPPPAPKSSPPAPKSSPASSPRTRPTKPPVKISPKRAPSPRRAPSPARLHKCSVCGQASKTSHGNLTHMRTHAVGFTSLRMACNPCGLWFPTPEEAAAHHRSHKTKTNPYKCRRCDNEFKQLTAYDEHFENKECTPFDEVPDVKCDVCWHLFATNKRLDEHRCLGEDHRPGGKCGKCRRSYGLLKNLKKHEQTCTAKKKGQLIVDPALLSKVKPIQIRMSRCDPLLTNLKQEHYDVSNVTADFGLDKNCVYPYIASYSRLRIKSDPDGMVDINAEIKDEFYIEEDYIHWDSEESGSEEEGSSSPSLVLPYVKKKKIETLANLTLKTLFSKRCLGKVPKKKRRVKGEKMFDSLLVGTEDDVTRDINNIIDNLSDGDDEFDGDSQKGGGESQNVDDESQKGGDESQKVDDDSQKGGDESQKEDDESQNEDSKDLGDADKSMDLSDDKAAVASEKDISNVDDNDSSTEKNTQNNDISEINDKNDRNTSEIDDEKDTSATKNVNSAVNNDSDGSNNNISSNNNSNKRIERKVNNGINSLSFDYFDGEGSDSQKDELKIDFENSQDSNSIGGVSESLLNENTQSDVNSLSDKETNDKVIDKATSLPEQNSDVDNKSQSNEPSVDNLSQNSKMSESEVKITDSSQKSEDQSESQNQKNDNVTETDYKNAISVIVNSGKNKMATDSEEMDDSKLMEALDAQIGNTNEDSREQIISRSQVNENSNDKLGLEELLTAKSSDTDGYQDFNFDA